MRESGGFSLIEIVAVVLVISAVTAISVPAMSGCIQEARKGKEISAARKLIAAYLAAADDNDGALLPGYAAGADAAASDASGQSIGFPANARYPWRLAPYLDYDMHAILFNGNEGSLKDKVDFHYAASVSPNLGMNVTFVGGDYGSASDLVPSPRATSRYGAFCVTRLGQASRPSKLIVFASARRGENEVGFYQIKSPNFAVTRWSGGWDPKAPASAFGFVDLRYGKRAVAAMLDGHVDLLDEDGIKDMRHWSNQAADEDNPNFVLKRR